MSRHAAASSFVGKSALFEGMKTFLDLLLLCTLKPSAVKMSYIVTRK